MTEQRLVPTRQLTEVADCLEAMATGKGGWAWADVLDELRAVIDGPGAELPPQYQKQAKTMLICDGEDVSPAEVGHWFSPEYIAELLAAPPAPVQEWPVLDRPAKVGNGRFHVGVSSRLVVEAAQRHYEYEVRTRRRLVLLMLRRLSRR